MKQQKINTETFYIPASGQVQQPGSQDYWNLTLFLLLIVPYLRTRALHPVGCQTPAMRPAWPENKNIIKIKKQTNKALYIKF